MLRPHKNGNYYSKNQHQLPVTQQSPIHHHHRRRKRLGGDDETISVKIKVICLVLVSVILVFVIATHSTTRNLNLQQQEIIQQEERAMAKSIIQNNKYHQQQHQHRFMMEQNENDEIAVIDTDDDADAPFYDLVIVGAGPAGLAASLFGARAGLSVLVLGSIASSQLYQTTILDNFPSYYYSVASAGAGEQQQQQQHQDWLKTTQMQATAVGVHFALSGLTVNRIRLPPHGSGSSGVGRGVFGVELSTHEPTSGNDANNVVVAARSVIIATGAMEERLHLPGEDVLWAKSVHSCAICDGSIYINKTVIVVGGGDAAVEAVLLLSRYATKVYLVHRRTEWRASDQNNLQTLLLQIDNVQILTPFVVQAYDVTSSGELQGVVLQHTETKKTQTISCDGVFVMIGSKPNTNFIKDNTPSLKLDPEGYLVVSNYGADKVAKTSTTTLTTTATSVPGIFAAGQVVDKTYRQAITAAASGAQAAIDAERWLRQQYNSASIGIKANQRQRHLPVVPLQTIELKASKPQQPEEKRPEEKQEALQHDDQDSCDLTREDCIRKIINRHPVVVFSKSYCPYCKKALAALEVEGVTSEPFLHVIDLTKRLDDGRAVQATLQKMTGRSTVPNVFVGGKSIGGGDETSQLHRDGKLKSLLNAALAFAAVTS